MDESTLINIIVNSGVVAVLFYLFIVKVSDKLDRLIEEITRMNTKLDVMIKFIDGDRHDKHN